MIELGVAIVGKRRNRIVDVLAVIVSVMMVSMDVGGSHVGDVGDEGRRNVPDSNSRSR